MHALMNAFEVLYHRGCRLIRPIEDIVCIEVLKNIEDDRGLPTPGKPSMFKFLYLSSTHRELEE